jgi:dihydrofolate reductase
MKIVVTENITLDGVIDMEGGWFDPSGSSDVDESDIQEELRRMMSGEDGLLLGRKTFESFRGYWPKQSDDDTGITDHLNVTTKYVVSSTLDEPGWSNTTVLRGPLLDEVRRLRQADGRDLGVTGSISVVHELIAADLVDEYRLFIYPVVIGRGARLFTEGTERIQLQLVDSRAFRSGVALLTYRPSTHRTNSSVRR